MRPDPENPSENKRTPADRLSDAPVVLWLILAVVLLLLFVAAVYWIRHRAP